jgi:hypothetical protein
MTKREWLANKGLAIPGARGKFSTDAQNALAAEEARCKAEDIPLPWTEKPKPVAGKRGRKPKTPKGITQFEKSQGIEEEPTLKRQDYEIIVSPPKRRDETEAWVFDQNGFLVGIMFCGKCQRSISRCSHDVPYAPDYLGGGLATLEKPEV